MHTEIQKGKNLTFDQVLAFNVSFDRDHRLTEFHLAKVNWLKQLIEYSRWENSRPQAGDTFVNEDGKTGYIEKIEDGKANICFACYTPFVDFKDKPFSTNGAVYFHASGGPWYTVGLDLFKFKEQRQFFFCTWANTPCANGAVDFPAIVNHWQLNFKMFS